jgi:hypothetical protein
MLKRLCLVLAFVALALAACGQSTVTAGAGPAASVSATATITPTTTATSTPSPTAKPPASTNCVDELAQWQNLTHVGDLLVRMEFSLAYPSTKLPDNIPLAPYKMTSDMGGKIPHDPSVNPNLALPTGGYYGAICNASASATHTLTSLVLRIDSFTPYSGQVNEWNVCATTYTRQGGPAGGGCGGGVADINCAQATFPTSARAGSNTPLVFTGCTQMTLPHALPHGMLYGFNLGIAAPTAPGTYTFSLGISLDGAAPVYVPVPHQLLLDSSARVWDGKACTAPAMLSQIPASDTAAYVCPQS